MQVNDDELLQMHLDAKENLRSAYAMLNDQYSTPTAKPLTIDALTELDSNGLKKHSENSDEHKSSDEFHKPMKQGPDYEFEDPVGASPVPLLTHVRSQLLFLNRSSLCDRLKAWQRAHFSEALQVGLGLRS